MGEGNADVDQEKTNSGSRGGRSGEEGHDREDSTEKEAGRRVLPCLPAEWRGRRFILGIYGRAAARTSTILGPCESRRSPQRGCKGPSLPSLPPEAQAPALHGQTEKAWTLPPTGQGEPLG